MNPRPFKDKLVKHLVSSFRTMPRARDLSDSAGITVGTFPENAENLRETWRRTVEILEGQGKLSNLVAKAAADDEIEENLRREFEGMGRVLEIMEKLSSFLDPIVIGLDLERIVFAYNSVLPRDAHTEDIARQRGAEFALREMVFQLIELQSSDARPLLVSFLRALLPCIENEDTRRVTVSRLKEDVLNIPILDLSPDQMDKLGTEAEVLRDNIKHIAISFETDPDQADRYFVRFYEVNDRDELVFSHQIPIPEEDMPSLPRGLLEERVVDEIDFMRVGIEAQKAVFEFYLPQSLLDLNPDQWKIQGQPLIESYYVLAGSLERCKGLALERKFIRLHKEKPTEARLERKRLIKNNYWDLVVAVKDWKNRWKKLESDFGKPVPDNILEIPLEKTRDLDTLRRELKEGNLHCVSFTFDPYHLPDLEITDLLATLYKAGMPIIFWSRDSKASRQAERSLKKYIAEEFKDNKINDVDDFIRIINQIRFKALGHDEAEGHLGRCLTLLLDNPKREIPTLNRNHL